MDVAPLAGAWIEISRLSTFVVTSSSLPSRERGLKFLTASQMSFASPVAPLAGAWIEILLWFWLKCTVTFVAPLAGAWIEIMDAIDQIHQLGKSLPSRERGLKYCDDITNGEQT